MSVFTYKNFNERKDKIFLSIIAIFLAIYMAFSCSFFTAASGSVREDVVRLHILANSDSAEDQRVKIAVRDALLNENALILTENVTADNAHVYFEKSKDALLKKAIKTLEENGFAYGAKITLQTEYYETRKYGELTFPAGEYLSLKVVLGEGNGKNWWCVMFPPLCIPAADGVEGDKEKTAEYLSPSGEDIVNGGKKYIVKFKLLEIFEDIKNNIR